MINWKQIFGGGTVTVVRQADLTEEQLANLLLVPDDHPVWRALMQLCEDEARGCNISAQQSVSDHGICASCNGGAEAAGRIRDRAVMLRERARKMPPQQ